MQDDLPPPRGSAKGPASYFPSIEKTYKRPVDEWFSLIKTKEPMKHSEIVAWLKETHGLGHGHANALVAYVLASSRNKVAKP